MEDWHGFYKPLWLAAALLNSSYSYYWDIERDWDIQWFTAPGAPPKDMSTCACGFRLDHSEHVCAGLPYPAC